MKRVIVIGCPGSGKSTFARALAEITQLPLYYLDMMYWNADRTQVEKSVFRGRLAETVTLDRWIIDGNYGSTMEERLKACDTVFFLDYPLDVCLDGIRSRRGKPRPDMPWIEQGEDAEFMEFIKSFNKESRPQILELLERYPNKTVIQFRSREESAEYLNAIKH